ncbi:hypothetical protein J8N05_32440 [Streptomyces sp. BH-SS-21]|uniref:DUF4034 domain-containing protein n=1 Tax=Streptomyces liliiviolaceus TaxID=2823109 RepID=A0A941B6U9_9ACTN|nr:hypothetical protein [Streptomyces liliiviolaceus]MBQ0852880.1 hypothetical protein [Streptomyces liliiviolaceus]
MTTPHPAGRDDDLRRALEDLRLNRWLSTKALLAATGSFWPLRTSRSQVLGHAAAHTRVIEEWCLEEPDNGDALMMLGRVLTERALLAHRKGVDRRELMNAVLSARTANKAAAEWWPDDPVPYVNYLALAQTDTDRSKPHSPRHWVDRPDLLPSGPWGLLQWVQQRDPYNREAFHRMLAVFHARGQDGTAFAQWAASLAPDGSPLKVLTLHAYVQSFCRYHEQGTGSLSFWSTSEKANYARQALDEWFEQTHPAPDEPDWRSLLDLNYLAYALTATGEGGAAAVFEAIGAHVTTAPWALVTRKHEWWQEDFLRARRYAMRFRSRR